MIREMKVKKEKKEGRMPKRTYKPKSDFDKQYLPHSNRYVYLFSLKSHTFVNNIRIDSKGKPKVEISKGNKKYPPELGIWVFNMYPAKACPSDKLGLCFCSDICYAKKAEKQYYQYTPDYRWRQNLQWETLSPEQFVNSLLEQSKQARGNKLKILRFSESGDFNSLEDLKKLNEIAKLLEEHNIPVFTYTARRDWDWDKIIPSLSKNLVINGSSHKASNIYIPVTEDVFNKIEETDTIKKCHCTEDKLSCDDCRYCMESNGYIIYCLIH